MNHPIITIIIATFNSEKTLPLVLESVQKQTFPRNKIEILLVDGGSTDKTFLIGKRFNCRIVNNPQTEPVYGKYLGYLEARGKYAMYLDHDEVIENRRSISLKVEAFNFDKKIKAVVGSGYKSPKDYHFVNTYINEFGDPFSFFIYRLSKDSRFFLETMRKRYEVLHEDRNFVVITFKEDKELPIIELGAGSSMFDISFFKKNFPKTLKRPQLLPLLFYILQSKSRFLAITKNDSLVHYSSDVFRKFLTKINWRVKNNIYHISEVGISGFAGRDKFQPFGSRFKKYLFIPYSYLIILPLVDALLLVISRKRLLYLLHLPLCVYTASLIVYHYCLKMLGMKPKLKSYDELREVRR